MYKRNVRKICAKTWLVIRDSAIQIYGILRTGRPSPRTRKEIYVIFRPGVRAPWQHALNRKFTHVFMIEDLINQKYGKGFMQYEFLNSHITALHLPLFSIETYIKELKNRGCTVLRVMPTKVKSLGSFFPKLVPYNCVSLTKLYLGIRAYHAITPYGLYKHLYKQHNVMKE